MRGLDNSSLNPAKRNITALLLCIAGTLLNLSLNAIVNAFGLPMFIDTVGTITVAALGGYLPGVIVGLLTNIVITVNDPTSIHYAFINVSIAVVAAYMGQKRWFRKPIGVLGAILLFAVVGGLFGAVVPWFLEDLPYVAQSIADHLEANGINHTIAFFSANVLTNIPDKAITVFVALAIMFVLPEKFIPYFSFVGWKQNPIVANEISKMNDPFSTKKSIKTKLIFILSFSLMLVATVFLVISLAVYRKTFIEEHSRITQGIGEVVAKTIDPDSISVILENNGITDDYYKTRMFLMGLLKSSTDVDYISVFVPKENGCQIIYNLDYEGKTLNSVGEMISYEPLLGIYRDQLLSGKKMAPQEVYFEDTLYLVSFEPVFDAKGNCVCYASVTMNMNALKEMSIDFVFEMVTIFAGFFIVITSFVAWLAEQNVIIPIKSITKYIEEFSYAGNNQKLIDKNVKKIRDIDIKTDDEIEKLYRSISKLSAEQAEQFRSIRRLSDSTSEMQEGLIVTMADMVENRDSDTGAHVQKTAAYVKIITEGLKRKGYYTEKITPRFMSDVVRSAPLHDVGKICVSDKILNKKGPFEGDEYDIMKTHTTEGRKIIERAIATVNGSTYLKEARNMAGYHHERWDGKGYPEGLHGEAIPLSARIMAVADVFDALTSKRVYKPAFPLDEALRIIQEGSGTQFDPKCVEVLMDSLPEVKVVLKKYNQDA